MKFTLRQKRFINFYEGNATAAALKAGYSKKTAYSSGDRLLKQVEILRAIENRINKKDNKKILNREERQEFWSNTILDEKVDIHARLKASELLGRSQADFVERIEIKKDVEILLKDSDLKSRLEMYMGEN